MDFGTLLHMAKKNSETNKNGGRYYSTKFAPPKKESKEKKLSDNIQKFLARRDQEEKERQRKEREKVASLLAMRDEKSKNKIKKMLKVTKSANKSVLDDTIDGDNTAVTMDGPDQPDQDDYGYVSTEANAFYQKYIEKVKDVRDDKGFAPSRPQTLKDLSGTKERVKAAITKEIEDKKHPLRQRTLSGSISTKDSTHPIARAYSTTSKNLYDPEAERQDEERKRQEDRKKRNDNRKLPPPPLDFHALLKLAEKKQHEPLEIPVEVKKNKEPERLLTFKEKREMEERQRQKEARERRDKERKEQALKERKDGGGSGGSGGSTGSGGSGRMEPNGRIPKLNQSSKSSPSSAPSRPESSYKSSTSPTTAKLATNSRSLQNNNSNNVKHNTTNNANNVNNVSQEMKKTVVKNSHVPTTSSAKNVTPSNIKNSVTANGKPNLNLLPTSKSLFSASSSKSVNSASLSNTNKQTQQNNTSNKSISNGTTREFPPRDIKSIKARQFPPADVQKTRHFPPADMRRGGGSSSSNSRNGDSRKPQISKRRILDDDDDDEDEYDSELDDFIDDGDCDEDISSHIKAIFGYDKSKYRDYEEDDSAMESNFAQVQREEYISKRIGIQEDLEDMKMEAMEKKRKMMMKKRKIN